MRQRIDELARENASLLDRLTERERESAQARERITRLMEEQDELEAQVLQLGAERKQAYDEIARLARDAGTLPSGARRASECEWAGGERSVRKGAIANKPAATKLRATVIIPVFNSAAVTRACLDVVLESDLPREESEVIVVDDGSRDETPALLSEYGDRIRVVRQPENRGFANAINAGAEVASGDYLILLNNDTIPLPGWYAALVTYADTHPRAGIVGSKLLYPNDTIQHAGLAICQDGYPRHMYVGFRSDHPAVNTSRQVAAVTGACVLIRREVFAAAGGLDTIFVNGWEDIDLCMRVRELGHEVHYSHGSELYHLESTSPDRFTYEEQNAQLFRARWAERIVPDDLTYYLADGLISVSYPAACPIRLDVSPELAGVAITGGDDAVARLLQERSQRVWGLLKENLQLRVAQANGAGSLAGSTPNFLPVPPPVLRFRVAGNTSTSHFIDLGRRNWQDLERALGRLGTSFGDFRRILDFGCGCGRVLRWFVNRHAEQSIYASDVDAEAVEWCRANLPFATVSVNGSLPPFDYRDELFDLVYTISVFTHLDWERHHAWLQELRRVVAPDGIVLATVHGRSYTGQLPPEATSELQRRGFVFLDNDVWAGHFPEWYQSSYVTKERAIALFSEYFSVVDYLEAGMSNRQDLLILQKR